MLISMLRNFTKGKDLVRPGATRFATAYLTLTCLHDNKGPLMTMFTSADWKIIKVASTPEGIRVQNMALDMHSDDEWITEDVNENIAESVEHSHLPTNDNTNDDPNSNEFAILGMNSNEFNMGKGGENGFIGDPQQNLIEEEDEHVNDDDDFVGRVEPKLERNDVSDEDGEDDDVDAMEDEDIGGFEF
ncbi:hypothetical protein HN873_036801 [Arachis hypogaea]